MVGAVVFYINHFVQGRVSKFTYGIPGWVVYTPSNPEHVKREYKTFINAEGKKCIRSYFTTMLPKVWHQTTPAQFTLLTDVCDGCLGHKRF